MAAGCLSVLMVYLFAERFFLGRTRRRIPLRIGVTGTRGKSSTVRLIAGALRETGTATLAKTTGSPYGTWSCFSSPIAGARRSSRLKVRHWHRCDTPGIHAKKNPPRHCVSRIHRTTLSFQYNIERSKLQVRECGPIVLKSRACYTRVNAN